MIGRPSTIEILSLRVYEVISCSDDDLDYIAIMCDACTSTTGVHNALVWLERHGWLEIRRSRGQRNQYIPKRRIYHSQPFLITM
jgi:hypothetical protein